MVCLRISTVRFRQESLSALIASGCPFSPRILVHFQQELVSAFSRKCCPFSARTGVRFQQDFAQAIAGKKIEELTLKNLLDNPNYNEKARKGFSTIKEDDSLITAKILMEKLSTGKIICSDIFVTEDGTVNTKVIGWITNIEIERNSII